MKDLFGTIDKITSSNVFYGVMSVFVFMVYVVALVGNTAIAFVYGGWVFGVCNLAVAVAAYPIIRKVFVKSVK